MTTATRSFLALTAADLMSREVVVIPRNMSLRTAGKMLARSQITGAPVVDDRGQCIGVLSASDFVHQFVDEEKKSLAAQPGEEVCSDWQVMDFDQVPVEEVGCYMTRDPVTTAPSTGIAELARMMLDAHIHRVIVVDAEHRPVGVVSSTDILAAVARIDRSAWKT
jgi:CBS domain-containing membrane protein